MSETTAGKTISELLRETRVEVAPETYVLLGLSHQDWTRLLENPELSPRRDARFMIFRDEKEVTVLIEEEDWRRIRHVVREARVEKGFRLVTLDKSLDWSVVGYLARVSEIMALSGISIGTISSFSRDHLLIKQEDLGKALRALGEHVGELC